MACPLGKAILQAAYFCVCWYSSASMTITAGSLLYTHTGANVSKMEEVLQQLQTPDENPLHGSSPFKRQVWHARLGLV